MDNEMSYFWQEKLANGHTRIGLNDTGRQETGDIAFIDFPDNLKRLQTGQTLLSLESDKTVSELSAPITGELVQINPRLKTHPADLNSSDPAKNWIAEVK